MEEVLKPQQVVILDAIKEGNRSMLKEVSMGNQRLEERLVLAMARGRTHLEKELVGVMGEGKQALVKAMSKAILDNNQALVKQFLKPLKEQNQSFIQEQSQMLMLIWEHSIFLWLILSLLVLILSYQLLMC